MGGLNSSRLGVLVFSDGFITDATSNVGCENLPFGGFPVSLFVWKKILEAGLVTCYLSFMNLQIISSAFFRDGVSDG